MQALPPQIFTQHSCRDSRVTLAAATTRTCFSAEEDSFPVTIWTANTSPTTSSKKNKRNRVRRSEKPTKRKQCSLNKRGFGEPVFRDSVAFAKS